MRPKPEGKITAIIWTVLAGVFAIGLIVVFAFPVEDWDDLFPSPKKILESAPVIDGHIGRSIPIPATLSVSTYTCLSPCILPDLPELVRVFYANNVSAFDLNKPMPGHVDIPRLRKGRVGGFFWYVHVLTTRVHVILRFRRSVYVDCPKDPDPDFVDPTWRVRYVSIS